MQLQRVFRAQNLAILPFVKRMLRQNAEMSCGLGSRRRFCFVGVTEV